MSDSNIYRTNLAGESTSSSLKDQTANQGYHAGSESFGLFSEQQRQNEMTSQSFGITDSVPHLKGPFQENQSISGSTQLEHIAGSLPQTVTENTNTISQGRLSTDSYSSPPYHTSPLQEQEQPVGSVQRQDITPIQSPENQMTVGTLRRNSSSLGSLSSSPGLGPHVDHPTQNIASSLNQNMPKQMTTGQIAGSGQQGNVTFSQSPSMQGTNTSVSLCTTMQSQTGNEIRCI